MTFRGDLPKLPEWLTTPAWIRSAQQFCRDVAARALAPEPELTVSQWSDKNRRLSSKASAEPGLWSTARTPYLREIMDAQTPSHPCTDSDFMKGTQIGGSEEIYNTIGYWADQVPCPIGVVMPTIDTCKVISKQRIQPMIDETPVLAAKFAEMKSRDSSNTVLMKDFPGGLLRLMGANSGPGLRNIPLRVVLQDEIDAYPDDVDGEGDPCILADKRTDQFSRAKRHKCSTPKIKGKSRIERRYLAGTQARYYVPCPSCKRLQWLKWAQMRWQLEERRELACPACGGISEIDLDAGGKQRCLHCSEEVELAESNTKLAPTDQVARAWYECEHCGTEIQEHQKTAMLEEWPAGLARHIHHAPGAGEVLTDDDPDPFAIWAMVRGEVRRFRPRYTRSLSWHVSALYSPLGWFTWARAVKQYLEAKRGGYHEETGESFDQVFHNTVLGEAYEVEGEQPEVNALRQRAEQLEQGRIPADGLMLVAACDVQGDRLEVEVDAFGEGEESWVVDFHVIAGDPTKRGTGSVWDELAKLLDKAYVHASGQTMRVVVLAVDSGYLTQDVYDFCRRYAHRNVIATKGDGESGKPVLSRPAWVDVDHHGKKIKRGVQLWHVGTDTAKERLYKRLELADPGPGYYHLPRWLPSEYFDQLASEKLVRKMVRGVEKHEWVKTRERNEALDLKILCYAAAIHAGLQRQNWAQLRAIYNLAQTDLFVKGAAAGGDSGAASGGAEPAQTSSSVPAPAPYQAPRKSWITGFKP